MNDERKREQHEARRRRRYEPPRIEESVAFETLALACNFSLYACGSPENS